MSNLELLVTALQKNSRRFFHFTDGANLPSIRQHGLLPTADLAPLGIQPVTGGDEASLGIDQYKGFDRYVRLSFCRKHPMSYVAVNRGNIQNLRILTVCPTVLLRDGVLIADRVATSNDAVIGPAGEMIGKMDLQATYQRIDWSIPENQARRSAAEKWELLVPSAIAPELIVGL